VTKFVFDGEPLLSRSTVDRREPMRDDRQRQETGWAKAKVLVVDRAGRTPVAPGGNELVLTPGPEFADAPPTDGVLLGEQDGVAYWGVRTRERSHDEQQGAWQVWQGADDSDSVQWLDLRGVGGALTATHAGLFATAVAALNWHDRARFCARCGAPVELTRAGWTSVCTQCGHEEYPRTDPAVICLVHDDVGENGSQVLLARQPSWPPHRYSVLAGFVEAGESLEATVRREIAEEVGVDVHSVRYLGSQPWPFPRSIMLGFTAVADPSAPLVPADGEIEEARWVSRDTLRKAFAADGEMVDGIIALPGNASIASTMLSAWAAAE
jgi:NAD+ diphosphatase